MVDDKPSFDHHVPIMIKATFMGNLSDPIVKLFYANVPLTIIIVDVNDLVSRTAIHIDDLVTGITDVIGKFTRDMELEKTILITVSKDGCTAH
jgi:hypothetical protein